MKHLKWGNTFYEFLEGPLKMEKEEVNNIKFDHVHSLPGRNSLRTIITKFQDFKQRQNVKSKARNLKRAVST